MKSAPLLHEGRAPHREPSAGRAGAFFLFPQRVGARMLHELSRALPPTIFFFVGFNFIVLTTNLLVAEYAAAVSTFMLATLAALVVGKAVITANAIPVITRFDRAPLIQPILFKSEFIQLFGPAEMRRLLFASRPSELQLNKRQRARELLRLSRLTDEHAVDQFRDPGSAAHQQLVAIVERLARAPQPKP